MGPGRAAEASGTLRTRQLVAATDGAPSASRPRSTKAVVPLSRAARARRRPARGSKIFTSPNTAAKAPQARPSSMAQSTSRSEAPRAISPASASKPKAASPGP